MGEEIKISDVAFYCHAFTEQEALRYYRGWRPSKLRIIWWRICYYFKYDFRKKTGVTLSLEPEGIKNEWFDTKANHRGRKK